MSTRTPHDGITRRSKPCRPIDLCEWGGCDAPATTIVTYPGVVPGTGGRERTTATERSLHVCASCAVVARDEADDMYAELMREERS